MLENTEPFKQATGEMAQTDLKSIYQNFVRSSGGKLYTSGGRPAPLQDPTLVPVNEEVEFLGNVYQLHRERPGHPNYHVIILRSEKTGELAPTFEGAAYALLSLNKEDESVNFGDAELPFYPLPVIIPATAAPLPSTVSVTVSDFKGKSLPAPPMSSKPVPGSAHAQPAKVVASKPGSAMSPIEETKDENDALFIENDQPLTGTEYTPGSGFVVYIDSMRFIPEACGPLKVNLRANKSSQMRLCDNTTILPDLTSTVSLPVYRAKRVMKPSEMDPTTLVVASLEMFDNEAKRDRILGFFVVNAFIESGTKRPISDPRQTSYKLNEGNFQLPIYIRQPFPDPFTMDKMYIHSSCSTRNRANSDTVPAASVLVRIRRLPPGRLDVDYEAPPEYRTRAYNTNFCSFSYVETELMSERAMTSSANLKNVVRSWRQSAGLSPDIVSSVWC